MAEKNLLYLDRWDLDATYLLNGVVQGFRMVDADTVMGGGIVTRILIHVILCVPLRNLTTAYALDHKSLP